MAYYHVCEFCGSNLDPNEKCDSQKQKQEQEREQEPEKAEAKHKLAS